MMDFGRLVIVFPAVLMSSSSSKSNPRPFFIAAGWVMVAAGIFFLGAVLWNDCRLAMKGVFGEGVITHVEARASSSSGGRRREHETDEEYRNRTRGGVSHILTVRHTPEGGEPTDFKVRSTFGKDLKEGDAVKVIYLPEQPTKAQIYSTKQLWLPIVVGFTASAAALGIGAFLLRLARRMAVRGAGVVG
jgi:hypothetical protein